MAAAYLNAKKLKGREIVLIAARHNLREIQAERGTGQIDDSKSHLNVVMAGARVASDVAALADESITGKLRSDAVRAVELVISLPSAHALDLMSFFNDPLAWARIFFGAPVLSAVIHLDESEPHCHILLLPLVDGRMIGSDLVGNKPRLRLMQDDFYMAVARFYGLSRPMGAKRTSKAIRAKAARMVIDALLDSPASLGRPDVRLGLMEAVERAPEALVAALGLTMPSGKAEREKSSVEIMTSPAKPEPKANHIGFAKTHLESSEPYHCVGFANLPPQHDSITLEYDDDSPSFLWNDVEGCFMKEGQSRKTRPDSKAQEVNLMKG